MIGVDTNVLLRHTLDDDPVQTPPASAFLLDPARLGEPVLLNAVVLIEFVWTLARREGFDKPRILQALDILSASDRVVFAEGASIPAAIDAWRTGRTDFADYLIGALNRSAGAATTMTFDADAAAHPTFTLLG